MNVPADKFEKIMEYEFHNAGGQRRNCGAKPKKAHPRYWGKGGKTRFNQDWKDYMACVNEVRKMNVSQGLPMDTGLPLDIGFPEKDPQNAPSPTPAMGSEINWGKIALFGGIGVVVIVGLVYGAKALKKGSATTLNMGGR